MVPPTEPSNKFNSVAVEVTLAITLSWLAEAVMSEPAICNFVALTSPPEPYTTDLPDTIAPADEPLSKLISSLSTVTPVRIFNSLTSEVIPLRVFNSVAEAVTREPANLRPPSIPSCDAILSIWFSSVPPIVTIPAEFCVTTFPLED